MLNNKRRIVHAQKSKEPKKNQRQPSSFRGDYDCDCDGDGDGDGVLTDCSASEKPVEYEDEEEIVDDMDT